MGELDGRVALITGGGRGIGRAIALSFAGAGAMVALAGRSAAALEETCAAVARCGGRALALVCDVTDPDAVAGAFVQARAALGPVDILVNNAGITASVKFTDMDDATWDRILRVNVTGAFYCCRAAAPDMIARQWGRVINVASIAALQGLAFSSAYSASKHALLGLTRSLALELGRHGITVNALCPGWTETEMLSAAIEAVVAKTGRSVEQACASVLGSSGQQRVIAPEEVAAAALRLAGREGDGVTGEAITIA
jgi:NAD(P)-dependent dehydrogenase (short-subunit alcohol dehydrogenase family)